VNKIDFRRVGLVAGLFGLLIVYAILWLRMIASRSERTGADFIAFYAAGRVVQADGWSRVYEPELQQRFQEEQVGFALAPGQVLLYNHVPYLLPMLVPLVSQSYVASFVRWVLLLLLLCALGTIVIARLFRQAGWTPAETFWSGAGILTFFPLFVSLMNGQDTAFALLGLCLWLAGLLTRRDRLAGLGLALTMVRPHIAVMLAIPFLFRRQRVLAWFCAGSAMLGLVSIAILGRDGLRGFLDLLLVSAGGEWYGLKEPFMVNLIGLLWRVAPSLGAGTIHWIGWAGYALALGGLCALWWRSRDIGERQIALAVTVAVFFAPHLHYHDLTLLLVALAALMLGLVRGGFLDARRASPAPLAFSLALLLGSLVGILKLNLPYVLIAALLLAVLRPELLTSAGRSVSRKGEP
jgi:hypothetical protein